MSIVIIDSSYYNFYRYFATVRWYGYSDERKKASEGVAWLDNETFMHTFEKMWFENIKKICKKFNVQQEDIIFARDGKDVWRYKIYPQYKAHRADDESQDDVHSPGPVFKHVNENYHSKLGAYVIRYDRAEADDIAAIAVRYIRIVEPEKKIYLITGDHDFLQLSEPNHVEIYQLKGWKQITVDDPYSALMSKILAGDPSDNIPPIYKGCGKKTAQRLIKDNKELKQMLQEHGREQYDMNRTLVDFNYIPSDIVEEIEAILDGII